MKLSMLDKLKALMLLNKAEKQMEEGMQTKNATKVVAAIIALITGLIQIPAIQTVILAQITAHPAIALALTGISGILAVFHNPKTVAAVVLALVLFGSGRTVQAQELSNIYAAGASYNVGGSPAVAGTALYAHQLAPDAAPGLYAFTAIDAVPNSLKPFTVNTNVSVGVAQKLATIAKLPIFVPTSAGVSFNGQNTGWQWNTGATTLIKLKNGYYLMPTLRLVKSSVSNGSGYQPIVGVLFGWGS